MNWKYIATAIISFGIGVIVGNLLLDYTLFGFTGKLVISGTLTFLLGLFLGGSDILGLIRDIYAERKERKIKHAENYFKVYFKSKTNVTTDFDYNECGNLQIQIKDLNEILEDEKTECGCIETHLKNEYKDVWAIFEGRKNDITQHNNISKEFLIELRETLLNKLNQRNFNKEDIGIEKQTIKYFTKNFLDQIGCVLIDFYRHPIDRNRLSGRILIGKKDTNLYRIYIGNDDWIVSDNEAELNLIKEMIIDILDKAVRTKQFELLIDYFNNRIKNKHTSFIEELRIIKLTIDSGVPLKGKCRVCKSF